MKIEDNTTEGIQILRGVRQGCVLSPTLFNIYSEEIFKEALHDVHEGILINGELINNIRYADDSVILARNAEGLQLLMERIHITCEKYGITLNTSKTKYITITKNNTLPFTLYINNTEIEKTSKYTYLGTNINEQWGHSTEIRTRIEKARAAFIQMKKVLTGRDLSLQTKIRLLRCYIFSTLLYGA